MLTAVSPAPTETAPPPRSALRRRSTVGVAAATGLLLAAVVLSVAVGTRWIDPATVWHVLWNPDGSPESVIVHDVRIPRTLLAIAVGAALGLAGAVMQALTRNPLAEPGLLGVNTGAATGVVIAIAFVGTNSLGAYVWFAFAGAGLLSVAVFVLGGAGRVPTPDRLVLAGVAVDAVLAMLIWTVLMTRPDSFLRYRHWDVGSLTDRGYAVLGQVAPFLVLGIAAALVLGRGLNALALGDDAAKAVGARPGRIRLAGMVVVMLLCGAATAAVGPIAFLGLAVPFAARLLVGADNRAILAMSLLLGPGVFLIADVLGRVVVAPSELQVGIVTALIGGPVFIALCRRRRVGVL
ncbi:iron ABC transporter permease [Asanoa ishikariensis]|uniref:Iron complex transport system permease protein n=1 Tax=Asanoa ishikariensis TaxID=137265 RepID=A0A1H3UDN4_9ACTN|nr:iron ABC transporter permease [Asanoa ishikariensis]GIF63788.1 iron ABC transporter permease [Asanoa ishikariensis]SDZ60456.1 iron complex transport system permease protein [Asanoa ishikariensis]